MNPALTPDLLVAAVLIALLAVGGWLLYQRLQSKRLEEHFGPEYRRAVAEMGSRAKAEHALKMRQQRVARLEIVPLSPAEAQRFGEAWRALQARFVDDPRGAVAEADKLVHDVMLRRGYPMSDFEVCAGDISVDHPHVVDHYRAAHAIAERDRRGQADTEDLRKALVHCRALFRDLLEVQSPQPATPQQPQEAPR